MALQLLPRLSEGKQDWSREKAAGEHLPYLAQIDDHTLLLRDGRLMQVIALDGLLFETADTSEINYRKTLRDTMLQAVGSSRFALYHHIIRRRVEPQLDGTFPDQFSRELDHRWRNRLQAKRLFVNDLYLCLIRRPLQGRGGAGGSGGTVVRSSGNRRGRSRNGSRAPRARRSPRRDACGA